jgi:type IV pilus assembly protein PilB
MKQRRLGDMLVSQKVLTAEQLNNALKQKMPGEKIGETLMRLKLIDEDQLTQTLCLQLGIEPVDLDKVKIPASVLSVIPADLCRSQQILPVKMTKDTLFLAMTDPQNVCARGQASDLSGKKVVPMIAHRAAMERALAKYAASPDVAPAAPSREQGEGEKTGTVSAPAKTSSPAPAAAPVAKDSSASTASVAAGFAGTMLLRAKDEGASDIHIEPDGDCLAIRMRLSGKLCRVMTCAPNLASALFRRLCQMAGIRDGETTGTIHSEVDYAVSVLHCIGGDLMHLRRITLPQDYLTLSGLGMDRTAETQVAALLQKSHGLILVSSPARSGKTSAFLSFLVNAQDETRSVIALSDPTSMQARGLFQMMRPENTTMAELLPGVLSQDPDVIGVDEIRDAETARAGVSAALSGLLVIGTIRADSAKEAVSALHSLGISDEELHRVLLASIGVCLAPTPCPVCHGEGCEECDGTGIAGRHGVFEIADGSMF